MKKLTITEMKKIAKSFGGKCLSKRYINNHSKLRWQCKKGHVFVGTPTDRKQGYWCPICAGNKKLTIEDIQRIVRIRGGKCLSNEYVNSHHKLKWQCKEGHTWKAKPAHIRNSGSWCPICSSGFSERICRKYFEFLFREKFPKIKPEWLVNTKGNKMELDGYCKRLALAFEYHGRQHYEFVKFFHRSQRDLYKRNRDDLLKKELCKEHHVTLIEIPPWLDTKQILNHIINQCKTKRISIPYQSTNIKEKLSTVYSPSLIKEMKMFAKKQQGFCISKIYLGSHTKLLWECSDGHVWEATPTAVKRGSWCPNCAKNVKSTIEIMKGLAKKREGLCLSYRYVNANSRLVWGCKDGHQWKATPGSVMAGSWCLKCYRQIAGKDRRLTIEEMKRLAQQKGGRCLSKEYINSHTKIAWQCKNKHIWWVTPNSIKNGHWCPICAGNKKLTIEDIQRIVRIRGGKCLSNKYVNSHHKLKWQCKKGHKWLATPHNIKRRWCPFCGGTRKLTIRDAQKLARSKEGKCLSQRYVNSRTKLKWKCKKGHIWGAKYNNIKQGHCWCPRCANEKKGSYHKLYIEDMQEIAKKEEW